VGGLRISLFLIGALALLSGGLKVRERARAYHGGVGMGFVEILVGLASMAATMPGVVDDQTMPWLISLSGGVTFVSTVSRGLEASKLRKDRDESESRRLYSQIKYGEALGGMMIPGDQPERSTGNESPKTIDGKNPWTD